MKASLETGLFEHANPYIYSITQLTCLTHRLCFTFALMLLCVSHRYAHVSMFDKHGSPYLYS